jgi:hypothetical protein
MSTDLDAYTDDELEEMAVRAAAEWHPETWLTRILPGYVEAHGQETPVEAEQLFADHHREFWAWLWAVRAGERPEAFLGVWGRGEAKSTSAEMGCVALGCRRARRYALYVCGTQDQADDHVGNIAAMLESPQIERWYPEMADRLVGKFGNSKGWRRNRIRTASGFTVDALGLDTAARGVKLEDQRPDLIVIDDIDAHDDSPRLVSKKIDALTKKLLPAGAPDLAVLGIQNLVHRDGVFARLVDGRAKFLARRQVSGPVPAVRGLVTQHRDGRDIVIAGTPTWSHQPIERIQQKIDDWGLPAFLSEAQHDVSAREGAQWVPAQLAAVRRAPGDVPDLAAVVVGVDPSGGSGPDNDAQGIIVGGKDFAGRGWLLDDCTVTLSPRGWGDRAVQAFLDWDADAFVAEVNYGGDMVAEVITGAIERLIGKVVSQNTRATPNGRVITLQVAGSGSIEIRLVTASRGKRVRAEPVAALYGRPDDPETWSTARVQHAGEFPELEDEMTSWRADAAWSPNRMDAAVWVFTDLLVDVAKRGRRRSIVGMSAA